MSNIRSSKYKKEREAAIKAFEYKFLADALDAHGSATVAARECGIDRVYMHRMMRRYGLKSPVKKVILNGEVA
jgi:transcriptional regulator of acetoin/glycerol metabolism